MELELSDDYTGALLKDSVLLGQVQTDMSRHPCRAQRDSGVRTSAFKMLGLILASSSLPCCVDLS